MFKESEWGAEAEPDAELGADVEEVIERVETSADEAALTDTDRHVLAEIFDKARVGYECNSQEWDQLFETLTTELKAADETDIPDILDQYRRKAKLMDV